MTTRKATFGLVLIALGLMLLLRSTGIISVGEVSRFMVPMGFILLGVWMIVRRRHIDDHARNHEATTAAPPPPGEPPAPPFSQPQPEYFAEQTSHSDQPGGTGAPEQPRVIYSTYQRDGDGKLRFSKTVGDLHVDLAGQSIRNVAVSGVFGDVEIRLAGSILADGLNRLVVSGFIGELRILIPRDLEIFAHCSNFIGDIDLLGKREAGFGNNIDAQTAGYNGASKRLYIAASNFIGDIRVIIV